MGMDHVEDNQGMLAMHIEADIPFRETAGHYLSKFYNTMKYDGEIWATKCPQCGQIIVPPMVICGYCKVTIEDKKENWLKLSDKGTIVRHLFITEKEFDKAKGEQSTEAQNPLAYIRLDGGDDWSIIAHWVEEMEPEKLHDGMRVQAVWREKAERTGKMSDILYFKVLEE